jgi:hypothetical protein
VIGVWSAEQIDALTEVVVQRLLVEGVPARKVAPEVAAELAATSPDLPALSVALPFSLAAAAIEEMLGAGAQARAAARDGWRTAAMIGADVLSLQSGAAGPVVTVQDLLTLWGGDEFFEQQAAAE